MSAPSTGHERRRRLLDNTAALAGLTAPLGLGAGLEPDVARRHPGAPRVLVGDAKDTETAGCSATARRLRGYAAALIGPVRAGTRARLVLAVPPASPPTMTAWLALLQDVTRLLPATPPEHARLDQDTVLVWVDLAAPTRMSTMRFLVD